MKKRSPIDRKTVLCYNYYNTGKCIYGHNCIYEHDKQKLIHISNNKYKKLYNNYIINDNIKIMLINLQNYNVIIKKNYDRQEDQFIILIAVIMLITHEAETYNFIYSAFNINKLNELIVYYIKNTKDINYLISICIMLHIPNIYDVPFFNNCLIYNKMFRGLLLLCDLKLKYIKKLLGYITLKNCTMDMYNYMMYLNDYILKITYNKNNKNKIYNIHGINNIISYNNQLECQIRRNICNDKQLIIQIFEHAQNDYRLNYYNNVFIRCILYNISDTVLNDTEYMCNLIFNNIFISKYININKYITNISLIKLILFNDITQYHTIKYDNKSLEIISIGCNININEIPYNDILKAYAEYLYKIINKQIGEIYGIYKMISEYVIDVKNINEKEYLKRIRLKLFIKS